MIKKLDHLVITTEDIRACLSFYQTLGFQAVEGGGRYELFAGDFKINVHIKGRELEPKALMVQPGSADLCFEIEGDIAEFARELASRDIFMETEIVYRHGTRGAMQSVYVRDPDGNLLEFCSYII